MHVKKAECAAMHEKNTHISQFLIIYDDGGGMWVKFHCNTL